MILQKNDGKTAVQSLLLLLLFLTIPSIAEAQSVQEYYYNAVTAFEDGDYESYLSNLKSANNLRPNHRVIEFRLAAAYVLTDQLELAVQQLRHRIHYYAIDDFSEDSLFRAKLTRDQIEILLKQIEEMSIPVQKTMPAFSFERQGFHPEGIIYSNYLNSFLISDARCGELISVDPESGEQTSIIDLKALGYWAGLGMAQDPENSSQVWIASSALFNYCEVSDSTKNKAAVIKFDLETKEVVYSFEPEGAHAFGDLIVNENGEVYITDSIQPHIYKFDSKTGKTELWLEGESYWNLQGLAIYNNSLIVSDYISGLYAIDLETKQFHALSVSNELLRGSDGIYVIGDQLYLLQNGTQPMRVSTLELDNESKMIEDSFLFIESGIEDLNEPTLGTFYEGELYYIYNSPWAFYDADGIPELENWPELKVHRYRVTNKE